MARALRDAGFQVVTVELYAIVLDGLSYHVDHRTGRSSSSFR